MQTIIISEKNALTKSITISGYINPQSSHTRLMLSGVSLGDLAKLVPFKQHMMSGFNAVAFDLNNLTFSII